MMKMNGVSRNVVTTPEECSEEALTVRIFIPIDIEKLVMDATRLLGLRRGTLLMLCECKACYVQSILQDEVYGFEKGFKY